MENAIIGTDLSAASDRVINNSSELKHFGIKKITLVYVLNLRSTDDFSEYNFDSVQDKLNNQTNHLINLGFDAESKVVMGIPVNELIKQVRIMDAGLLVIGSRGHTWSKPTLGETASEVLHNIKCPVLVMAMRAQQDEKMPEEPVQENLRNYEKFIRQFRRQEPTIELIQKNLNRHVLLTTDFSDFSENAFQWLKNQLSPLTTLTIMHIQDEVKIAKHLEHKLSEFNQIDTSRMERLREEFRSTHPETEVNLVLEYGNPKLLIPQYVRENAVTLTVMGSQGRGYISQFFLGSVSLRVARQAESNVLIIPYSQK